MSQRPRLEAFALVLLRTLIGWHFLYEGYYKLVTPGGREPAPRGGVERLRLPQGRHRAAGRRLPRARRSRPSPAGSITSSRSA